MEGISPDPHVRGILQKMIGVVLLKNAPNRGVTGNFPANALRGGRFLSRRFSVFSASRAPVGGRAYPGDMFRWHRRLAGAWTICGEVPEVLGSFNDSASRTGETPVPPLSPPGHQHHSARIPRRALRPPLGLSISISADHSDRRRGRLAITWRHVSNVGVIPASAIRPPSIFRHVGNVSPQKRRPHFTDSGGSNHLTG